MAVGNETGGKKYKSFKKPIIELNRQKEDSAIWKLASDSEIGVHYHIYIDKMVVHDNKARISKAVTIKPDITMLMEKAKEINDSRGLTVGFKTSILRSSTEEKGMLRIDTESSISGGEGVKNLVKIYEHKAIIMQECSQKSSRGYDDNNTSLVSSDSYTSYATADNKVRGSLNSTPADISGTQKKISPNFMRVDDLIKREIDNNMTKIFKSKNIESSVSLSRNSRTVLDSESLTINDKENIPSFCKAFFITSVPYKHAKKLTDSEEKLAPCKHPDCSILPAYKPEILYRYPVQDTNALELNSLVSKFILFRLQAYVIRRE
jgi:hypothetical protein